jgi:hypothetical protein
MQRKDRDNLHKKSLKLTSIVGLVRYHSIVDVRQPYWSYLMDKLLKPKVVKKITITRDILVISMVLAFVGNFFIASYANIKPTEALIFNSNDGWCNPQTEGIGEHCFGDFAHGTLQDFKTPWTNNPQLAYPPLAISYFKLFHELKMVFPNSILPLVLHLALMMIAILFPVLHLRYKRKITTRRALMIASAVFSLSPILMSIDRGNNQIFLLPLLYLFYFYSLRGQKNLCSLLIVLMVLWRPQMFLLVLIFIPNRQWKMLLKTTVLSTATTLLSFLFFPWDKLHINVFQWLNNAQGYQNVQAIPSNFPTNWSFSNSLLTVIETLHRIIFGNSNQPLIFGGNIVQILNVFFLIAIVMILFTRKNHNEFKNLVVVTCLPILVPGVSYGYYLSLLIVPATYVMAFLFNSNIPQKEHESHSFYMYVNEVFSQKFSSLVTPVMIFFVFVPWPLSLRLLNNNYTDQATALSITWHFAPSIFLIWFFSNLVSTISRTRNE